MTKTSLNPPLFLPTSWCSREHWPTQSRTPHYKLFSAWKKYCEQENKVDILFNCNWPGRHKLEVYCLSWQKPAAAGSVGHPELLPRLLGDVRLALQQDNLMLFMIILSVSKKIKMSQGLLPGTSSCRGRRPGAEGWWAGSGPGQSSRRSLGQYWPLGTWCPASRTLIQGLSITVRE